jgi:hypothetical protein
MYVVSDAYKYCFIIKVTHQDNAREDNTKTTLSVLCSLYRCWILGRSSVQVVNMYCKIQIKYLYRGILEDPKWPQLVLDIPGYWLRNFHCMDRLCGLVVRVSGYRYRSPGFDSRRYQIFWVVVGLERGPLSLVMPIEELLDKISSGSGLDSRDWRPWGPVALTTWHPSIRKSWY